MDEQKRLEEIEKIKNQIKSILGPLITTYNYRSKDKQFGYGLSACLHPGCCNIPIDSHLYSAKFLRNIKNINNEVDVFNHSFNINNIGKMKLGNVNSVNLKQASTFRGFCEFHDTNLFSSFENEKNNESLFLSKEQCDEYVYRIIMFELFNLNAKKIIKKIPFKENNLDFLYDSETYENCLINNKACEKFINNDISFSKKNLEHLVVKIKGGFNLTNHIFMNYKVLAHIGQLLHLDRPHLKINFLLKNISIFKDIFIIFNCIQTNVDETTIIFSWDKDSPYVNIIRFIIYLIEFYVKNQNSFSHFISYVFFLNLSYSDWLVIKPEPKKYLNDYEFSIYQRLIYISTYRQYFYYNRSIRNQLFPSIISPFIDNKKVKEIKFFSTVDNRTIHKDLRRLEQFEKIFQKLTEKTFKKE